MSGYPQDFDEMALAQLVSPYGQVSTIKIVRDKQSGKAKGYAFIEMVNRNAAEEVAIALDGLEMKDKTLTVNMVEEQPAAPALSFRKAGRPNDAVKTKRPRLSR
jgi:RNA recognition motif-containing protein